MPEDLKNGDIIDSRYKLKEFLGGGRVGKVYLAWDMKRDCEVAIKMLADRLESEREKALFAREFAAVKSLNHPGVVKVYEQGDRYFSMEFVAGTPLSTLKTGDISYIFEVAIEITRVVDYIHRQGVIHRDLKPENIKIVDSGQIKILDFSFATCDNISDFITTKSQEIAGTLDYMAPEMIKGFQIDPRADLYSLGIIFYELATARLPFKSADVLTTVVKQIETLPPAPRRLNDKITPGFESIIMKLISKSPSKRHQSAEELLTAMLRLAGRSEILRIRIDRGRKFLASPPFCARREELMRLSANFDKAMRGRGPFVLIRSEEGMGKTSLIREFQKCHSRTTNLLLDIDCQDLPMGKLPVFSRIIEQIHTFLRQTQSGLAEEIFSRWGTTLLPLVPQLADGGYVGEKAEGEISPREFKERLCYFLIEISKHFPLGIFFDGLHWLDQASCELLLELTQQGQGHQIFLCGTYRPNFRASESAFERILSHFRLKKLCDEIELKPFTQEQLAPFLGAMVGRERLEGMLLEKLHEVSRGIPFLAVEAVKNLADDGLIFRKGGVWQIEIDDLRKVRRPSLLEESLLEKYDKLDKKAMRIMQAAAVIGHRFDRQLIERVAGVEKADCKEWLPQLTRQGFLSEIKDEGIADFVIGSPPLAQLLYEKIPLQIKQRLHERVAKELEFLSSQDNAWVEELAYHYFHTENYKKALFYLIASGDLCAEQYRYDTAGENYQKALLLAETNSDTLQTVELLQKIGYIFSRSGEHSRALSHYYRGLELAEGEGLKKDAFHKGIGISCFNRGLYDEALRHFKILYDSLRHSDEDIAEELSLIASVYIAVGDYTAAEKFLKEALDLAKRKKDRELQASIYHFFAEIHFMKGQWPNSMNYYIRAFSILQASRNKHLKARIARGISRIYIHKGRTQEAYKYLEEALFLCQSIGDREFRVMVEIEFGQLFEFMGQLPRALQIYQDSLEMSEDLGMRLGEARACLHLGRAICLYHGKSEKALELLVRSMDIFKELKVQWGIAEASRILGEIYTSQGEYELAYKAYSLSEKSFAAIHMKWMLVGVYMGIAEVLRRTDKIDNANKSLNKALRMAKKYDDDIMVGKIQTKYALFCAQSGHPQEALEHFISATVLLQRVHCQLELALAYYEYGKTLLGFERQGDHGFIKVAISQLEKALEIFQQAGMKSFADKTSQLIKECEREQSSTLYKRDLTVKLREFGQELSEFERDSQKELSLLRAQLEEMGEEMDRTQVEEKIATLEKLLQEQLDELRDHNNKLLSQVEELKAERESLLTLQKISNTINSVLDSKKLIDLIMDMVVQELRAERGFLVLVDEREELTFKAARNIEKEELSISDSSLSTSIVKKVIKTREPVLASDAQADGRFQSESIIDLKLRSILCVPFIIKDKVIGAVYIDNRFVSGLFTQRDLDFLISFSNQAAIAIENAFLYEELREKERIEQEINIAARIQAGLLPKSLPHVKGLEVYGKMITARKVGGDYYDFIVSPDEDILAVVIGDVTGKGIPAGLVMVMARLILHHFLPETGFSTKETLLKANGLLKDNTEPFIFMSMLLARWDGNLGQLSYTGAGHENLLLYEASQKKWKVIPAGGVVLGVKENIDNFLEVKQLPMATGDKVILYTDGVTESMSPSGDMLEIDGFLEMLRKHQDKSPRDIVHSLLDDLQVFMGDREQHDDITLTVLQKV